MRALMCLSLAWMLSACGTPSSEVSHVAYKVFEGYFNAYEGIYTGTRICMSGPYEASWRPVVGDALMTWFNLLYRIDPDVVRSIAYTCDDPHYTVNTSSSEGRAHATYDGLIQLYRNSSANVVAHEFGHVFVGLADTYVEGTWQCQPGQPHSLMCSTDRPGDRIMDDDFQGMKETFSHHATFDKPERSFRFLVDQMLKEKNCRQTASRFVVRASQISYAEEKPTSAYVVMGFEDYKATYDFRYALTKTQVKAQFQSRVWQDLLANTKILDFCPPAS